MKNFNTKRKKQKIQHFKENVLFSHNFHGHLSSFNEDLTPFRVVLFSFRGDLTSSRVGLCSFRGDLTSSRVGHFSFRGDLTSSRMGLKNLNMMFSRYLNLSDMLWRLVINFRFCQLILALCRISLQQWQIGLTTAYHHSYLLISCGGLVF